MKDGETREGRGGRERKKERGDTMWGKTKHEMRVKETTV